MVTASISPTSQERQPKLVERLAEFKSQNDFTEDILTSIKEKLKGILIFDNPNKREPDVKDEAIINSAMDEFSFQLRRQRELNERLSDVLLHLKEVI